MPTSGEISLYFHIPFCTHKCAYCHFYVIPDKEPFKLQLIDGLKLEWEHWLPTLKDRSVISVYFGGGTPSLMGPAAIGKILSWVQPFLDPSCEITLEANPENITLEQMRAYRDVGINRVSIGVQSLDAALLEVLDRKHSASGAIQAVEATHQAGMTNISIDLMYDLPHQTLKTWETTLQQAVQLPITHLSLYNLTIEPHTLFFKYKESLAAVSPDEESSLQMYLMAVQMLQANGLSQYEISAFCREGLVSRHNVGYWIGRPFLGFGPSAFSYWDGKRFRNVANLSRYSKALAAGDSPIDFEEELTLHSRQNELLAIHLRLLAGVDLMKFQEHHGALSSETLAALQELARLDLLSLSDHRARLTQKGVLFYDSVASELV